MRVSELRKKRELDVVSKLDKFGIMTAKQLLGVDAGGLRSGGGGVRNVHRVMREMEKDGIVKSRRYGVKLYSLEGFGLWEHTLMRNDFLIDRGVWRGCRMEIPVRENGEIVLVADAGWRGSDGEWVLLEVDRSQKKKVILEKIEKYRGLGIKFEVVGYLERKYLWEGCVFHG